VADALVRVGDIPLADDGKVIAPQRVPNWPAVISFLALSLLSLAVAIVTTGEDDLIHWDAAIALLTALLAGALAVLYRHSPTFWRQVSPISGPR